MVAAVVVAAVAGVNVYEAQVTETAMSDLQMENIEADASCSLSEGGTVVFKCEGNTDVCYEKHIGDFAICCSGERVNM